MQSEALYMHKTFFSRFVSFNLSSNMLMAISITASTMDCLKMLDTKVGELICSEILRVTCYEMWRIIQNPIKHLRWSVLRK